MGVCVLGGGGGGGGRDCGPPSAHSHSTHTHRPSHPPTHPPTHPTPPTHPPSDSSWCTAAARSRGARPPPPSPPFPSTPAAAAAAAASAGAAAAAAARAASAASPGVKPCAASWAARWGVSWAISLAAPPSFTALRGVRGGVVGRGLWGLGGVSWARSCISFSPHLDGAAPLVRGGLVLVCPPPAPPFCLPPLT